MNRKEWEIQRARIYARDYDVKIKEMKNAPKFRKYIEKLYNEYVDNGYKIVKEDPILDAREKRNAYYKKYRNSEKFKEYQRNYYKKNRDRCREYAREYYEKNKNKNNKEKCKEYNKKYYEKNKKQP